MNLVRCKTQIKSLYEAQPSLRYDYPKLTRQARGEQKEVCLKAFGGIGEIDTYLLGLSDVETHVDERNAESEQDSENSVDTTGVQAWTSGGHGVASSVVEQTITSSRWQDIQQEGSAYLMHSGYILIAGFLGILALMFLKYLFEFLYDVMNSRRLVYMRVMLPRGDSKLDREREKELAKDMKEKIGRMSQVYRSLYRLGNLDIFDSIMQKIFHKPKFVLSLSYQDGQLQFIVGTYPEYMKVIEGSIAAQYSEVSIEPIKRPKLFTKKYRDIMAIEPKKNPIYPIKIYKQLEDDPVNNLIDSISKIPKEDEFHVLLICKPVGKRYNKKAAKWADGLYRNDETYIQPVPFWKKVLLAPVKFVKFLTGGYKGNEPDKQGKYQTGGKDFVRMLKSQEDSINTMGEEAASQAFMTWFMLLAWSDQEDKVEHYLLNTFAALSVYTDEYNNEFEKNDMKTDIFGRFFKRLWKFAAQFSLPSFFFDFNVFSIHALSSLFHLPDSLYNRSPAISWMDYKMLAAPDDVPLLKEETGFIVSGIIADTYLEGKLTNILADIKHPSIGFKMESKTHKTEVAAEYVAKAWEEIVEEDGKRYAISTTEQKVYGFKTYKDGILLGVNNYRNMYTPIYMKRNDRTRHHYIIWKSGTGKSVFIDMLARQDIWAGDGCCVIDPHGDLVESVLQYVPKERAKDVIYFDAGNEQRPMGLNLYEINDPNEADRAVNDATEIFLKMFGPEIFGPRIQEYFKYGSLTLLEDMEEGATLLDVPRLFTDETYREYKTKKVKNPVVRNFREKTYTAMGDREKQEIIPYFTSKFVSFNTNSLIRNIIGQTKSAFNFREVMDSGKILLINLSKGKIGELNAQLLGMILVSKIYNGAMGRANIDEKDRRDFYLYVDEFQNFVTNTFADILSEARKYKLALIMAHQYIAQLDGGNGNNIGESGGGKKSVKDAVFGNVGTMQSFKVGAPDAEFLEKEYAPVLSSQDILGIANYKTYLKLNINNSTSRVFSMNSIYTNDYRSEKVADILKQYSEKKYGRKKEYVDAEITARLWMMGTPEGEQAVEQLTGETQQPAADLPQQQPVPQDAAVQESIPVQESLPPTVQENLPEQVSEVAPSSTESEVPQPGPSLQQSDQSAQQTS